jgi:hypothetical protein
VDEHVSNYKYCNESTKWWQLCYKLTILALWNTVGDNMPNTYTELLKTTVGTATSSVTLDLTGISGYTDLVLVISGTNTTSAQNVGLRFNGDTTSLYSRTSVYGDGTSALSTRDSNQTSIFAAYYGTTQATAIIQIMNYSNATTFKTIISRSNDPASALNATVGLYRSTSAITSLTVIPLSTTFAVGSTFSLYGIANADQGAAKATGGIITEDSQYWYHTFGASGTFTPKVTLTTDILVVAGGASGGNGGGGAGGLLAYSSQSVSTAQTVTVGAGGAAGLSSGNGVNGNNSQFGSLTAATGGGKGAYTGAAAVGGSGGGGASNGAGGTAAGAAGTSGQGSAGGTGASGGTNSGGGGGGGATAVGGNGTAGVAGAGGAGSSAYSSYGAATSTGQNISGTYWYAGGGGGGAGGTNNPKTPGAGGNGGGGAGGNTPSGGSPATSGTVNTGGGGGGIYDNDPSGAGGSGVVIIRYSK